ncbi:MAG: TonB-dependent receptor [Proteobacteria bacterium]|nr:TonB-dependent receptor [Pseudomonadota bacterium]
MRILSLLCGVAVAALFISTPARTEEIQLVVTATRSPTPANDLPVRVDVISSQDIEALGLMTLTEAIGPNAVQAGGTGQQTSVFLRGTNSNHVLALLDGVRLNDSSTPTGGYDFGEDTLGALQSVEVLRGPTSSIYGADALGGVINLIPRRGGATAFNPYFELAGGSFATHRVLAGAAGTNNGLDYGVSVESFDTAGFDQTPSRFVLHTGERDAAEVQTGTLSARQRIGDFGVDALFRLRHSQADYDTFSGGASFDLRADSPNLTNDALQSAWRLGGDVRVGPMSIRLSGGQVRSDRSESDGGLETTSAVSRQTFADLTSRFVWRGTNLTLGFEAARDNIDTRPQFADPLSFAESRTAAYVIGESQLFDHLTATASVRADRYERFGTRTTYQIGATSRFDAFRLFGTYGTAFKAPSLSERFEQSFFNHGNPDLRPEDSRSWEIGGEWGSRGGLTFGGSFYQTRINDLIEYDFGALKNINVGRVAIDGVEARAEWAPADWASIRVSYDWTRARDANTGAELARRPEHSWRLDARMRPARGLGVALEWTYVGERRDVTYDDSGAFLNAAGRTPAFNVGAVSATYDIDPHAQIFARIDNISDVTYEQPAAFAGAPRSVIVGLRTRY